MLFLPKSPIAKGIGVGLAVGLLLLGGAILSIGYMARFANVNTLANDVPAGRTVAFVRSEDAEWIWAIAKSFNMEFQKETLPGGFIEIAIVDNGGRLLILRSDGKTSTSGGHVVKLQAGEEPLSSILPFTETVADRKLSNEWIYISTDAVSGTSAEEQTVLSLLSPYKGVLAVMNGNVGTAVLEKHIGGDWSQAQSKTIRGGDQSAFIANVMPFIANAASGSHLDGMMGILRAKLQKTLPFTATGISLDVTPLSFHANVSGSGTTYLFSAQVSDEKDALAQIQNILPQATIRTIELKPGVVRRDVTGTETEILERGTWRLLPVRDNWFVAQNGTVVVYGNDEALLSELEMTDDGMFSSGILGMPWLRSIVQSTFPFFGFERITHPLIQFLNGEMAFGWSMEESREAVRIEWKR